MIILAGRDYKREIVMKRSGECGGFIDINPKDGEYAEAATEYMDTLERGEYDQELSRGFELVDTEFDDRFSEVCQLKDPITGRSAFIFRDHMLREVFILPNVTFGRSFSSRYHGKLTVETTFISKVEGPMKNRRVIRGPEWIMVKQLGALNNHTVYEPREYERKFADVPISIVFSLGSAESVFGPGSRVTVRQVLPHTPMRDRVASGVMMNCPNILLPFAT